MDTGTAAIIVATPTSGLALAGFITQQLDKRRTRRDAAAKEHADAEASEPDKTIARLTLQADRAEAQAASYYEQLTRLQAKDQQLGEDMDRMIGENRELRQNLEEARAQCNKQKP